MELVDIATPTIGNLNSNYKNVFLSIAHCLLQKTHCQHTCECAPADGLRGRETPLDGMHSRKCSRTGTLVLMLFVKLPGGDK